MFVAIFDEESRANDASTYLTELQIGQEVIAQAVLKKNVDGRVLVEKSINAYPEGEVRETPINSMIDLLRNDPAMSNAQKEAAKRLARINDEFLSDVSKEFKPGRYALVSDVHRDDMYTVDDRMDALGGNVFRTA